MKKKSFIEMLTGGGEAREETAEQDVIDPSQKTFYILEPRAPS